MLNSDQHCIKGFINVCTSQHFHPYGNLQPSDADLKITKKIKEVGTFLDISVLDHLILSEDGYMSLAEDNIMP